MTDKTKRPAINCGLSDVTNPKFYDYKDTLLKWTKWLLTCRLSDFVASLMTERVSRLFIAVDAFL